MRYPPSNPTLKRGGWQQGPQVAERPFIPVVLTLWQITFLGSSIVKQIPNAFLKIDPGRRDL